METPRTPIHASATGEQAKVDDGVLRFDIPALGIAGVGDSPPVRDALVPVRRQDGGINTGGAVHNRGAAALMVRCMTPEPGRFSAVAFELDGVNRIFTTLPVVPVVDVE